MAIALLADAHLGGPGGAAEQLVDQLRGLRAEECEHLIFLGDLFHVWVGDPRYETAEIRSVVAALRELAGRGVALSYVEGNRDFYLAESPYSGLFRQVAAEVSFVVDGKRFLAVHGDGLNDRDWRYRFWRSLSKSPACRLLAHRLPTRLARWLMHSTESRLARTNFKHRLAIPERAVCAYGERRLRQGHDVVLLGHFHVPRRFLLAAGEVRILDAWYNTHTVEWIGRR